LHATHIVYDTKTGEFVSINRSTQFKDGDYSLLRTYLVVNKEQVVRSADDKRWETIPGTYKLLLTYPKGFINPHALDTAVAAQYGGGDGVDPLAGEGNWMLPERLIQENLATGGLNRNGHVEAFGKSQYVDHPADIVVFHSIELFNKKFGPSLEEQLFRITQPVNLTGEKPRGCQSFLQESGKKLV